MFQLTFNGNRLIAGNSNAKERFVCLLHLGVHGEFELANLDVKEMTKSVLIQQKILIHSITEWQ